jgi:hypothetical protein
MESNLDEDGMCLRGLPCHRLSTSGQFLMFKLTLQGERKEEKISNYLTVVYTMEHNLSAGYYLNLHQ